MIKQFRGKSFSVPDSVGWLFDGEKEVLDRWWDVKSGDVVFDVGCASGLYTLPALALGAYVFAFDANTKMCDELKQYLGMNPQFLEMCEVHNIGIGSVERERYSLLDALVEHGVSRDFAEPIIGHDIVPFTRLDSFMPRLSRLDWIKIDVESYELDVLQGTGEILKRFMPKLIIENHTNIDHIGPYMKANSIWERILALLHGLGYRTAEEPYDGRSHLFCD